MRPQKKKLSLDNFMAERNEDIKTRSKVFSHLSATLLGLLFVF